MSAVQQALASLSQVVSQLENSIDHLETNLAGEQRDMFGAPAANGNGASKGMSADLVAQKLDSAIENVEKILQEGSAA